MKKTLGLIALALVSSIAAAADKPGEWKPLLDAKFSQFDVYLSYRGDQIMSVLKGKAPPDLKPVGLNPPGQNVFTMIEQGGKPVLRISGEIYGCATTRQEFSNYHFRASFKWGEKKWEPRLTELKDSGILYHSRGAFGVDYWKSWALSQEFQVIEHGIGEYWRHCHVRDSTSARIRRRRAPKRRSGIPQAPWMEFSGSNNNALAGSDEDRPGEWNTLELVCFEDRCVHIANGKVVMALKNARYQDGDKTRADDGRQAADPERSGGGVLQGHRNPRRFRQCRANTRSTSRTERASLGHRHLEQQPALHHDLDVLQHAMSLSGSPFTAMTSPNFPSSMVPTSLAQPM